MGSLFSVVNTSFRQCISLLINSNSRFTAFWGLFLSWIFVVRFNTHKLNLPQTNFDPEWCSLPGLWSYSVTMCNNHFDCLCITIYEWRINRNWRKVKIFSWCFSGRKQIILWQCFIFFLIGMLCDGFKETSRNLEVFFIKVSKNERRTYPTNFITVSINNGPKIKLNSNFVLALLLSYWPINHLSGVNSPTNRNLILTSTDLQLMNSIVPKPYMILMKCWWK